MFLKWCKKTFFKIKKQNVPGEELEELDVYKIKIQHGSTIQSLNRT